MDFKKMTINERVKYIRENELGLTLEAFGKRIEMTKGAVSYMEKGNRVVSERTIKIVCSEFNINKEWLTDAEGEIFVKQSVFSLDEYAKQKGMSELDLVLIKCYLDMPKEIRSMFMNHVRESLKAYDNSNDENSASNEISTTTEQETQFSTDPSINQELLNYKRVLEEEKNTALSTSQSIGLKEKNKKVL